MIEQDSLYLKSQQAANRGEIVGTTQVVSLRSCPNWATIRFGAREGQPFYPDPSGI